MTRRGKILVSHPNLPLDNPFHKTAIYMYQDDQNGSVGVCLNRQSAIPVRHIAEDKGIIFDTTANLFRGGPVNQSALVLLHTNEWQSKNTAEAGRGYRISSDDIMLEKLAQGNCPVNWRMMSGFSAWAPNQLNMEIQGVFPYRLENRWLTCDANDSIIFEYDGEEQWQQCLSLATKQMVDNYF